MSGKLLELRCDKKFIDSTFEGYKLSLKELTSTVKDLPVCVNKLECIGDSFSYLSVALHSMHDHLIMDPWRQTLLYFIDERMKIIEVSVNPKNNSVEDLREVLQIPSDSSRVYRYNASVVFSDSNVAFVADGSGLLHIVNTGDRGSCQNWTIDYSGEVIGDKNAFVILDGRCVVNENSTNIHCLLTAIEEIPKEESSTVSRARTAVFWVELQKNDGNWENTEPFKITSDGSVRYGYFEPGCKCVFIESTKPLKLPNDAEILPPAVKKDPQYFWQQSADDIKIWCAMPKNCAKEDVKIDVNGNQLNIAFKSENFLSGETFQRLDSELTTWNVTENR
ncbi:hypothetical protein V9T40_011297 [Parthenolecanium corni]|uniref:NudC domain-containing protein 1 n=1 Tax=Parthenolecanium corni TaxID=536013 RepID=A0AAN9XY07_9HEMI